MSDSDDTELLLLIPPDFFILKGSESDTSFRSIDTEIQDSPYHYLLSSNISLDNNKNNINIGSEINMSSNHYHLPTRQQREIDEINAKISKVERSFTAIDSDISTASNRTVLSNFRANAPIKNSMYSTNYLPNSIATSTPKNLKNLALHSSYRERLEDDNGILKEIDKYLEEKPQTNDWDYCQNSLLQNEPITNRACYSNKLVSKTFQNPHNNGKDQSMQNTLISLNDLWESKNIGNIEHNSSQTTFTQLQEERFRRQHCEKTIQALQGKLLEYQQKISVALQVDKAKDNAISSLQDENESIKQNFAKLEENLRETETKLKDDNSKLQNEISDIKLKKECLEKELSQALNLAAKFQDKNEVLEVKVENYTKSSDEIKTLYKKQIEDMELRVLNAEKSEDIANIELKKLQDILAKSQLDQEKASKQASSFKRQLDTCQTKVERLEKLEEENKILNETIVKLSKREKDLSKDMESQKVALKTHYQHQLEKVVEQKLVEFQTQLDSVEETLKAEARQRERTIAERAIKQLEMINEKNEQEILLINEKHNEEVELYRIQLINASKKIEELEEMLNSFRNRRVDIAEKLHTVMETQWQKALEILTSPNSNNEQSKSIDPKRLNKDKLDGLSADSGITKPENESFSTPTSSRNRTNNRKHDERLQAYIELLLSKSPRDLDNLDTILNIPKSNSSSNERSKHTGNSHHYKAPWK